MKKYLKIEGHPWNITYFAINEIGTESEPFCKPWDFIFFKKEDAIKHIESTLNIQLTNNEIREVSRGGVTIERMESK